MWGMCMRRGAPIWMLRGGWDGVRDLLLLDGWALGRGGAGATLFRFGARNVKEELTYLWGRGEGRGGKLILGSKSPAANHSLSTSCFVWLVDWYWNAEHFRDLNCNLLAFFKAFLKCKAVKNPLYSNRSRQSFSVGSNQQSPSYEEKEDPPSTIIKCSLHTLLYLFQITFHLHFCIPLLPSYLSQLL